MKNYDFAIYIGRFNIPHVAHLRIAKEALTKAENLIFVLGSHLESRTPTKNPFDSSERREMLELNFTKNELDRIHFIYQRDYKYVDPIWASSISNQVDRLIELSKVPNPKICLVGSQKDNTSYYIEMFPQWKLELTFPISNSNGLISSSNIRKKYFEGSSDFKDLVSPKVYDWLMSWKKSDFFINLQEEYNYIKTYKDSWKYSPYPVTFQTVDAVVFKSNHVLVVERKVNPGKGLMALPGGFLDTNELLYEGCIRELYEETKIVIPKNILIPVANRRFDHPDRSERGRTITDAFNFDLGVGELPKVKGGDDAKEAFWIPFHEVSRSLDKFFEDHAHIIEYFMFKNGGK